MISDFYRLTRSLPLPVLTRSNRGIRLWGKALRSKSNRPCLRRTHPLPRGGSDCVPSWV